MFNHPKPIVCSATWTTVMQAGGWQCHCTGACGSRHTKTGLRCDRDQDRVRLIAAPADLTLSPLAAARVSIAQLIAWCPECHRKAAARQRAHNRQMRRREERPADTLFDL